MTRQATRWFRFVSGVVALVILVVSGTLFKYRHEIAGFGSHFRHSSSGEIVNYFRYAGYWLRFLGQLEFDWRSQTWDFPSPEILTQPAGSRHQFFRGSRGAGLLAFHRGDFATAVSAFERERQVAGDSEEVLFWLAMSYLRLAESENCLEGQDADGFDARFSRRECALPLTVSPSQAAPTERAMELLAGLLDRYDRGNRLYQWLLSFAAMARGDFPSGVPSRYRIDSPFIENFYGERRSVVEWRYRKLRFEDRARELGVDTLDAGKGVAVEDFDLDGDLDLVTGGNFDTLRFYVNEGGKSFSDRTTESGLAEVSQPFIITAADYDNDGWMDVFVARPFDKFQLFRNRGGGTFVDVTESSGLHDGSSSEEITVTSVSAWGDIDNDGDLDLFLAQMGLRLPWTRGFVSYPKRDSVLFINHDGRFVDSSGPFGLRDQLEGQFFVGAAFGDLDNDGDLDLFLSSPLHGMSRVLRNQDGRAFEVMSEYDRPDAGFMAALLDIDHDGRLDIFQGGWADARTSTARSVFGEAGYRAGSSAILRQEVDGRFKERESLFRSAMPMGTMGASYGDLNNDGCLDFYLGTGNVESWFILPNLMYIGEARDSRCTGSMDNISMLSGFGSIQKGHGIVFFDFDNDGDQDIYSSLGGMWPGDRWPNQLFVNESDLSSHWVKIRLRGVLTNRFGLGARIRVVALDAKGGEIVRRYHMTNKTGFGSAPYLAHIGLGRAVEIRRVEVYWPVSGCLQSYEAELDSLLVLSEGSCRQRLAEVERL